MKHLLIIFSLLLTSVSWSEDYFIDNNGKRTIVTEHYYNDKSLFRAFKIEGSFTDNIGNYGNWNAFVTTYITDGKVTKLDFSNQFKFQNKKKLTLPHPKSHLRNFVLYPIFQIDPKWSHPILGKNVVFLINNLSQKSRIEITRLKKNVNIIL